MKNRFFILFSAIGLMAFSADKPSYQLYSTNGRQVSYQRLVTAAAEADVILFGELHNNPICHWLQLELTRDLYDRTKGNLVMGAEMFEADNQVILDELITGRIRMKDFENEARLWPNFKTDYKPLLLFAVEKKLKFVADNVPRRYASLVNKNGFEVLDSLSEQAKTWLAPLPIPYDAELPGYKEMVTMMGPEHANPNLPKAQALKDATMAWFILQSLKPGQRFVHFNGTYHSDNFEGIVWYLKYWRPELKVVTISSVSVADPSTLPDELEGKGTFILAVHERITTTH